MSSQTITQLRAELTDLIRFLPKYAKNPVEAVRTSPDWTWPALLSLQVGMAIVSGALVGLSSGKFVNFILGLFVFPITCLLAATLISFFIHSYFALFHARTLERRRLFGIVVLATMPFLVMNVFSEHVPAVRLIGFAATCFLLVVGLSEHFKIPQRLLVRLVGGIYFVFFLVWGIYQYNAVQREEKLEDIRVPKALDELQDEVTD